MNKHSNRTTLLSLRISLVHMNALKQEAYRLNITLSELIRNKLIIGG